MSDGKVIAFPTRVNPMLRGEVVVSRMMDLRLSQHEAVGALAMVAAVFPGLVERELDHVEKLRTTLMSHDPHASL